MTQILTLKDIPDDQLTRLELIESLYNQGLDSSQVSDYLNKNNILTPTGLKYSSKLVWVSYDKFQKRKKRIEMTKLSVDQDYFYLKKRE